jgi:hypothetical protein
MCGIAGIVLKPDSGITPVQRAIMASALTLHMEMRGKHSYGLYRGDTGELIKGTGYPSLNVRPELLSESDLSFIHTRHASVGEITIDNTHPWQFTGPVGTLIGMHNGGIANYLKLNEALGRDFKVDSQHFFQHLVDGLDVEELRGYGAVAWTWLDCPEHPERVGRVYLGKFNTGVLNIFGIVDKDSPIKEKNRRPQRGVIFASTSDACRVALRMAGFDYDEYADYTVDADALYYLDPNVGHDGLMFWFAEDNKKGLDLHYYTKEQARSANIRPFAGGGFGRRSGYSTYKRIPSSTEVDSALVNGFRGLRGWELSPLFEGLISYNGTEKCKDCGMMADVELEDSKPVERFCTGHWLKLIYEGASCVVPVKALAERLTRVGDDAEPAFPRLRQKARDLLAEDEKEEESIDEKGTVLCELCTPRASAAPACYYNEDANMLACEDCVKDIEAVSPKRAAMWQHFSLMGKECGGDSEGGCVAADPEEDTADLTVPVVQVTTTLEKDEKSDENAAVTEGVPCIFKATTRMCDDCVDYPAEYFYVQHYFEPMQADAPEMGKRASKRERFLCRPCLASAELSRERFEEKREGRQIYFTSRTTLADYNRHPEHWR